MSGAGSMSEWRDLNPRLSWAGWVLPAAAIALSLGGILAIYISEARAEAGPVGTMRQIAYLGGGLLAFAAVVGIGHQRLAERAYWLYGITLGLLVLLLIARRVPLEPFIRPRRNAYRWIELGPVRLQVSEIAKITLVLATAWYLRFKTSHRTLRGLIPPALLALAPTVLVLLEPDLGTAMLFMPVSFAMIFAAGARRRHVLALAAAGLVAAPVFYFSPLMSPYQRVRVQVLLRQNEEDRAWQRAAGYQLRQSKIAIGSGGWSGAGLQPAAFFRHKLLPEDHNDFIFAVLAHQWGFVGCLALLAAYVGMAGLCLLIASGTVDPIGRLVAVGVAAMFFVQMFVNVGMTIGLLPITGMTLPLVSFGGSSLIANYAALGLVCSVARRRSILLARRAFEFVEGDEI